MHTSLEHLENLFKGVRDVRETVKQYCLAPDMAATSMDDLKYAFEQTYDVSIDFFLSPDLKDQLLRGMYLRFGNQVKIYLDKGLAPDWLRYVGVKEMCHLILKDAEYMTSDPAALIELMIYEETSPLDGDAPLDMVADMWAKYAAHELLFPHEERAAAKAQLAAGEATLFSLAQTYEVPEHVIDWVLSDGYMSVCDEAWNEVKKAA